LLRCVRLSLRSRELRCDDYAASENPPVLYRKETFLQTDHPLHEKFARLTRQEEQHGLLAETATIGTRKGWQARLDAAGFSLRGHRLVRQAEGQVRRSSPAAMPADGAAEAGSPGDHQDGAAKRGGGNRRKIRGNGRAAAGWVMVAEREPSCP
jgi:hypothetical protein